MVDTRQALADAEPTSFWLDDPARPEAESALIGDHRCDLLVVGGGYSGLWTAVRAKERNPDLDVILLESHEVGSAATGRNGGFCEASLTHGLANGHSRWPAETATLSRLGAENLQAIEDAIAGFGIACDWERSGSITVATEDYQLEELREFACLAREYGGTFEELGADEVRAEINSPTFVGGLWDRSGVALVNPARLAWGLKRACLDLGVRIHERTPATGLTSVRDGVQIDTPYGQVVARRVALATNVFPSLVRRHRPFTVPVYDYVLMTEPLTTEQLAAVGWRNRQGFANSTNQFHYVRLTADQRILWGGYDAVYNFGGRVRSEHDQRPETFASLARHFFETFPQLEGVRFSHSWGGAIDTSTRFCAFFDLSHQGRVAYAAGYTGLGVGATRFGADVMLDLLAGESTERTRLQMVRQKPLPFPPEPLRSVGIGLTRWSLGRADAHAGQRNLWLRSLDRLGLGFDS